MKIIENVNKLWLFSLIITAFIASSCAKTTTNAPDTWKADAKDAVSDTITDTVQDANDIGPIASWKNIKLKDFPDLDPKICAKDEAPNLYGFNSAYKIIRSGSFVRDKNFYLFNVLEFDRDFTDAVKNDAVLKKLNADTIASLKKAVTECTDVACLTNHAVLNKDTVTAVAGKIKTLFTGNLNIAARHLRPCGVFALFADENDATMVTDSVKQQLDALNHVIGDYMNNLTFEDAVKIVKKHSETDTSLFFTPLLNIAMDLMMADNRDEAGRYEPMETGENKAAVARVKDIDWNAYPFTAILTPGQGPTDPQTPLSDIGAGRCDESFARWKAGAAPFIVTSGGNVHPDGTRFTEAIEMKKYLMGKYKVPQNAIIVDPHARHTTTNLRDVTRLLIRYGIPVDRPFMTTTDFVQSGYILFLGDRCMKELGYKPWRALKKMTKTDNCLLPTYKSLYYSPDDPLDP